MPPRRFAEGHPSASQFLSARVGIGLHAGKVPDRTTLSRNSQYGEPTGPEVARRYAELVGRGVAQAVAARAVGGHELVLVLSVCRRSRILRHTGLPGPRGKIQAMRA